jgi:hypothetical protein
MKVFISWSGQKSKYVAAKLKSWLPLVLHFIDPWMSEKDIFAGDRWSKELAESLQDTKFGIVVLTGSNRESSWIHFEAGALSKSVDEAKIIPYLVDLELSDLDAPLSQFQAKKAEQEPTFDVIKAINNNAEKPISEDRLRSLFSALWPDLEKYIKEAPADSGKIPAPRPQTDILEELVLSVKSLQGRIISLEGVINTFKIGFESKGFKSEVDYQLNIIHEDLVAAEELAKGGTDGRKDALSKIEMCLQKIKDMYISVELKEAEKARAKNIVLYAKRLQNNCEPEKFK